VWCDISEDANLLILNSLLGKTTFRRMWRGSILGWVLCHHSTARPQVADGGNDLQLPRVNANTLNTQPRQPIRGGPPAWWLGVVLTTFTVETVCYETYQ
jgi:hypothetical protein